MSGKAKYMRFVILFLIGSVGYSALEIMWRGYTHWTMFVLGGLCFYVLYNVFSFMDSYPVLLKALAGGAVITAAELVTGCIINLSLHWNVWNYSLVPYNFLGQICLLYSLIWVALCIPLSYLCSAFRSFLG